MGAKQPAVLITTVLFLLFCRLQAEDGNSSVGSVDDIGLQQQCSLCHDGSDPTPEFANKNATTVLQAAGVLDDVLSQGLPPVCQVVAGLLSSRFGQGSAECSQAQSIIGGVCGCPPIENFCQFCPNDADIPQPNTVIPPALTGLRPAMNCADLSLLLTQVSDDDFLLCSAPQQINFLCGCNKGQRIYMGADTDLKRAMLAWLPRLTGLASLVGSLLICLDVLRDKKRRMLVYSELVLAMSLFDCCSSVAWIASTAAIPEEQDGLRTGIYGASGNEFTCKAQGYLAQVGLVGSCFYNLVLSGYYVCVVVKSLRESQLRPLRKWVHATCPVLAFGLAFAGIPYYTNMLLLCQIGVPPLTDNFVQISIFVLGPISMSLTFCVLNITWVYLVVRKQNKAAAKWRMRDTAAAYETRATEAGPASSTVVGSGATRKWSSATRKWSIRLSRARPSVERGANRGTGRQLDRVVLWQASFYLASFLLTWPFYYVALVTRDIESYAFWVVVAIMAPLQGFFNWIVYMRPRWGQGLLKWQQEKQRASLERKSRTTGEDERNRSLSVVAALSAARSGSRYPSSVPSRAEEELNPVQAASGDPQALSSLTRAGEAAALFEAAAEQSPTKVNTPAPERVFVLI